MKKIFVLHEYGAPSHYRALEKLAGHHNYCVEYIEFNLANEFRGSAKHPQKWFKFLKNVYYMTFLPFMKRKKIVLGIAPYNEALHTLMLKLKKHEVYYHTSYTCWDGSSSVHPTKSLDILTEWKYFTNSYVKHIFAVSMKTKSEMIKNNFSLAEHISIVNHSYPYEIKCSAEKPFSKSFIQVAALEPRKGIEEILIFFSRHSDYSLTIVGRGVLEPMVIQYAEKYKNIEYKGYLEGFSNIEPVYKQNSFLIMNSKRTNGWEELFGMAIIEAMACGCVPIAVDHPGPLEIIENNKNGILCKENEISAAIIKAGSISNDTYNIMRREAIASASSYSSENMSSRWIEIFK